MSNEMNRFPRQTPEELDTSCDLEFQVLDWYIPEADRSEQAIRRAEGYPPPPVDADGKQLPPPQYEIHMHGVTKDGTTVCVEVSNYEPYFFLRVPNAWYEGKADATAAIKKKIAELKVKLLEEKIEKRKRNGETYTTNIIPWKLRNHLSYIKLVWRKDFWGFTNGKDFPFLKLRVKSLALFQSLRNYFLDAAYTEERAGKSRHEFLAPYETNIDPFLRFIHERNIAPCGWIRLPGGSYEVAPETDDGGARTRAGYNVRVCDSSVYSLPRNQIAPLLVAAFDIECTSSHGDFPVAKKDYRKLATDLIQVARECPQVITPDSVVEWISGCFQRDVVPCASAKGVIINRVYPKNKVAAADIKKMIQPVVRDIIQHLQKAATTLPKYETTNPDDEDDAGDEDDEGLGTSAAPFTNAVRDKILRDILLLLGTYEKEKTIVRGVEKEKENGKVKWVGVLPKLCGDQIIQIGTTVHRYGSDEIIYRHITTLNSCDEIEGADVEVCNTEEDVLTSWKDMIQRLDPDIITGYNIFGFDMKYMWERAEELGVDEEFATGLGRIFNRREVLEERKLSSSALGDNIMHTFDMDGVVIIDMLKVMQRDQKLDSYKLDHVAQQFLGDQKDDLKPREIFEKFLGSAADRCVIARYCLQDCALVNRLLHKLKVLENNIGMGNVCSVPLSYLFMRGQGVKIFSLVAKECRANQTLIPVLKYRGRNNEDEDAPIVEDGYEGAIVLDPQEGMYLDDPITVLDYSSLYPSSMISRNLSHDCFVQDQAYANMESEGIKYETVVYDVYEGTGDKKHVVGKKECVFAQLPDGKKGIIPSILQKLLQQRKNTRKKIEYERLVLTDGRIATGLVKDVSDTELEVLNVDMADVGKGFGGHKALITKADVVERQAAFHPFEQAVLDALQLAYKITANSLYGQIGSRTSPIYWKDIAACTTATGREMIMLAKKFVETEYGATVIYGDSVLPDTPVLLRDHDSGLIYTERISAIEKQWKPYDVFKASDSAAASRHSKEQSAAIGIDVWTDLGWSPIVRIIRHKCNKRIYFVNSRHGSVAVTEDHSLLDDKRRILKPEAITKDTELLHSFPKLPSVGSGNIRMVPMKQVFSARDAQKAQDEYMLLRSAKAPGARVYTRIISRVPLRYEYVVSYGEDETADDALPTTEAVLMYSSGEFDGYVYDLETEEGVFQAGVGSLIVKNTDSIFCKFPNEDENGVPVKGRDALPIAIASGQRTSREIKKHLPPPQCLEYEKTFYPFIIFSKKRYVGNLYEEDPNKKPKQKSMGIVLKRRDNAPIVKRVYGGIIDILLNKQDLNASVEFLNQCLTELVEGRTPLEDLIITKTLRAEYKDPTKIAHKVLAERMGERDAGNKPLVNDRIPYVYIVPPPGTEVKLQGDRIEHPDYIREAKLTPDYRFYITNQMLKPICQMYALCLERLPGYEEPEEYWAQMEAELKAKPLYAESDKRCQDRIQALRMRMVEELLFHPYLCNLSEVKITKSTAAKKKAGVAGATTPKLTSKELMAPSNTTVPVVITSVDATEVKRGKTYEVNVEVSTRADQVLYRYQKQYNGKKIECLRKGLQDGLRKLCNEGVLPADPERVMLVKADKLLVKTWKDAVKKGEEGLHEDIARMKKTTDISLMLEIESNMIMAFLVHMYHHYKVVLD